MIQSGQKTYELRLYDNKRQQIQINDEIEFTCIDAQRVPFRVIVLGLHVFKNYAELYAALPLLKCGYTNESIEKASPDDMNQYYSTDEQSQYGAVGIENKRI